MTTPAVLKALHLPPDATEAETLAAIKSLVRTPSAVELFRSRVADELDADPKLTLADAQLRVSTREPELFSATRNVVPTAVARNVVPMAAANRFSASNVLAEEARRIARRDGVSIAEAQVRATREWPDIDYVRVHASTTKLDPYGAPVVDPVPTSVDAPVVKVPAAATPGDDDARRKLFATMLGLKTTASWDEITTALGVRIEGVHTTTSGGGQK
jgi:hypothetical protein